MRFYFSFLAISIIILLIDVYFYRGIRLLLQRVEQLWIRRFVHIFNLLFSLFFLIGFGYVFANKPDSEAVEYYQRIFLFSSAFLTVYIPKIITTLFLLAEDTRSFIIHLSSSKNQIKRRRRRIILSIGIFIGALAFLSSSYGITFGKFRFNVHETAIQSPKIPKEFEGYKIVQLSDFHISCYINNEDKIDKLIQLVNELNPDLLVFTGDMVNNTAAELSPFVAYLSRLKATDGKYSILGNHDYGNYTTWESESEKQADHELLIREQESAGFRLLMNESVEITRGGEKITLLGVENIGKPPFPVYGDLVKAMEGTDSTSFRILLSHDPSHWDMEVLASDIELTLSGHTHGMQLGIEIPGWQWSPAQYRYPRWAGLYEEDGQYLYVNRGIGFIGYSGRLGIWPEISLFTLHSRP
jgi:uncharacterized protein